MSTGSRKQRPISVTVVIWLGMLVGVFGLAMLVLGIGGITPVQIQFPGAGFSIQTSSAALAVMAIGFLTAVLPILFAMRVDEKRSGMRNPDGSYPDPYLTSVIRGAPSSPDDTDGGKEV